MSSKFKILSIAVVAMFAVAVFATTTMADVTGSFSTRIVLVPQTTVSEIALIDFDVVNNLDVSFVISGLNTNLSTDFGIAGVENLIATSSATLGALDISSVLVFGRFAFGSIDPFYDSLTFLTKILTMSVQLGGVTFTNTSRFDDVNAFVSQTAAFAFGDVFSVAGQTPSGVSISAATGVCMQQVPFSIKNNFRISPWTVNPDCATTPKPDILFDFETITISGVPITSGVSASANINCVQVSACAVTTTFAFAGGVIPFSTSFTFTDLLSLSFGGADITLTSGAGTLVLEIGPTGSLSSVEVSVNAVLNPDTNPASLSISAEATPGVGLTDAVVALTIQRAGLTFGAVATFTGGPPAEFSGITFSVDVPGSLLSLNTTATFSNAGLVQAVVFFAVTF